MTLTPAPFCEIWRGPFAESHHLGHAVLCDDTGQIVRAWGDPHAVVLPRSSSKMIQALPLITSGAADARGLSTERLALACASHQGATVHVDAVSAWLRYPRARSRAASSASPAPVTGWSWLRIHCCRLSGTA